jgi:outer membrane protein assembly factor BamE (lipoprotein component of BamABCDE complex)
LAGCVGRIGNHGDEVDPDRLDEIVTGQHTRNDVAAILGSPSTISMFDDKQWYYISNRTETLAFLAPEVTEQKIIVISFNAEGFVDEIGLLGLDQKREVELVDRETPTTGTELSVIDQFLGNLGRFGDGGSTSQQSPF